MPDDQTLAEFEAWWERSGAQLQAMQLQAMRRASSICVECGKPWLNAAERWRSRLTIDDEAAVFCPACDEQEFGGS